MNATPAFHAKAAKQAADSLQEARDEVAAATRCIDTIDAVLASTHPAGGAD